MRVLRGKFFPCYGLQPVVDDEEPERQLRVGHGTRDRKIGRARLF
ncbi:hypothetical protein Q2T83_01905 [Fervidibacter sacchari]|uniref:Uncharacterized protein n=1 Tax=Candidatus Fervidibacter sacchari TaxID=1448929 RepID=A0ABT2ESV8_9BACT|nr:hypothetical protein [Candidatus Fervidibacter sacchari]MCS3921050.1 hypothetical protein [Candidatus Fervidibacter sacchari]WKU16592.1 hypothetical protein Q2T83_01905 [Candidatus Fervidibacter sacchari]